MKWVDYAEFEEARAFRRYFLKRLAVIALLIWAVSWPIHLLPHTVLWVFLAIVALAAFLISPSRPPIPGKPLKRSP